MIEFSHWIDERRFPDRPWLVLGKGPSFDRRGEFDLAGFHLLGLNHVVREVAVDVAVVIDLDVVDACGDAFERNARWLLLPRYPHVDFKPGPPLSEQIARSAMLTRLDRAGRLVVFDLSTAQHATGKPTIEVRYFVAEAALNILGEMGATRVRSLGVDGGTSYARTFSDLTDRTLLANGQPSFDKQFPLIARIVFRRGLDYASLAREAPIRVFIGSDPSQRIAARVLEYSIRRNTSMSVDVRTMIDLPLPTPADPRNRARTPFSFYRFAIPALAGHKGRAIYLDSDMLVLSDLTELWDWPMDGAKVVCAADPVDPRRRRQFSVMLLDCERLDWDAAEIVRGLDAGRYTYEQLMQECAVLPADEIRASLPERWNSLEKFVPGVTSLIHYTDMLTQPYVSRGNPNGDLWVRALRKAYTSGCLTEEEVREAVRRKFVRPSLLFDLHGRRWGRWVRDLGYRPHGAFQDSIAPPQ